MDRRTQYQKGWNALQVQLKEKANSEQHRQDLENCPACGNHLYFLEAGYLCPVCGYSNETVYMNW